METSPPITKMSKLHQMSRDEPSDSPRSFKRQKVTRACDCCKSRKRRCTGEVPCKACYSTNSKCTYTASYTRGRLVEPLPAAHLRPEDGLSGPGALQSTLAPTSGLDSNASRAPSPEGTSTFAGQYLGPSSPYTFLRRAWKRFEEDGTRQGVDGNSTEELGSSDSIWSFGDRHIQAPDLRDFRLPPRAISSALFDYYFDMAMPTYRFLHRQTTARWLEDYHLSEDSTLGRHKLPPARQALVLMVLATARFFNAGKILEIYEHDEQSLRESERIFQMAQTKLRSETGRPRLESVQARIASCLYLLHTSRPNQAWYQFGTATQLLMALGLHRGSIESAKPVDAITRECRKRTFWAASTLDTYLSVMLGRPPLIQLHDMDQRLPHAIDDEDLSATGVVGDASPRDSIIRASILHAQITRIVKKAAREQYSIQRKHAAQKIETADKLNSETAEWHASLPVVLSGAVHPSSLIPIFRRQITVLKLAHGHAQMLINRHSLLLDTSHLAAKEAQVDICLSAAKATLLLTRPGAATLGAGLNKQDLKVYWYTQFVCFNALSIIWVWVIQRKHNRLPPLKTIDDQELINLADTVQQDLAEATQESAPSLRYSIVLEELREEADRGTSNPTRRIKNRKAAAEMQDQNSGNDGITIESPGTSRLSDTLTDHATESLLDTMDAFSSEFPFGPDLWLSLDAFPFSDFGQPE